MTTKRAVGTSSTVAASQSTTEPQAIAETSTTATATQEDPLHPTENSIMTRVIPYVALALPALAVVLVGIWMSAALTSYVKVGDVVTPNKLAGFSWAKGDGKVFNWHPLLMTIGFVFCSTTAALSYIALPFTHKTNKIIHMASHGVGAVTAFVGAVAVFRFHNEHNITNLYSLHSWLGVLTWVLFVAQWVFGLVTFWFPGAKPAVRAATVPYHIGSGIGILALIYMTAATGVLEKLSFNASCNVTGTLNGAKVAGYMAWDCVLGNTIGLVLALALIFVVTAIVQFKITQFQKGPVARGETDPLVHGNNNHQHGSKGYHA